MTDPVEDKARPYTYSLPVSLGTWVEREAVARGESRSWIVKTALRRFAEQRGVTDVEAAQQAAS